MTISQGSLPGTPRRTMTVAGAIREQKPKRCLKTSVSQGKAVDVAKQAEHGVPLQAEQADWLRGTVLNDIDMNRNLEAHYSYMAKIQDVSPEESSSTGQPLETEDDSNVTPAMIHSNIVTNDNQVDQNAADVMMSVLLPTLANLIANFNSFDTEGKQNDFKAI
ncbi:hypothetical protein Tco_1016312 [Tanacetum coccineum]|uniref:Uncharacterized protein n=1 Tax=Tanacetum coccineum TaxID=301880 RepID=A0ABQ5FNB5_9ASTR